MWRDGVCLEIYVPMKWPMGSIKSPKYSSRHFGRIKQNDFNDVWKITNWFKLNMELLRAIVKILLKKTQLGDLYYHMTTIII